MRCGGKASLLWLVIGGVVLAACASAQRTVDGDGRRCEVAQEFTNAFLLNNNTSYRAIFPTGQPANISQIRRHIEGGLASYDDAYFEALLALSSFYSATADTGALRRISQIMDSARLFESQDAVPDNGHGWERGVTWLQSDAYVAAHYLNLWLVTRELDDLKRSLEYVERHLSNISKANHGALPKRFGRYWAEHQDLAAEQALVRSTELISKPLVIARLVAPDLMKTGFVTVLENELIARFQRILKSSQNIATALFYAPPPITDFDEFSSDAPQKAAFTEALDTWFWMAAIEEGEGGSGLEAIRLGAPNACADLQMSTLKQIAELELQTILGSAGEDVSLLRRHVQFLMTRVDMNWGAGVHINLLRFSRLEKVIEGSNSSFIKK